MRHRMLAHTATRHGSTRRVPPGIVLPGILREAPHAKSVIVLAVTLLKRYSAKTTRDCDESFVEPPFGEGLGKHSQPDYLLGFSCVSSACKEIVNNL